MKRFQLLITMALLVSCSEMPSVLPQEAEPLNLRIDKNISRLSKDDAAKVALMSRKGDAETKADTKEISEIITIDGLDGQSAIYAVNYVGGGCDMISAVKSFYPVLATMESGAYTILPYNSI